MSDPALCRLSESQAIEKALPPRLEVPRTVRMENGHMSEEQGGNSKWHRRNFSRWQRGTHSPAAAKERVNQAKHADDIGIDRKTYSENAYNLQPFLC